LPGDGLEVAVVVATRNRAQRLSELLASLRAQTLEHERFEVIVVDDASEDATPNMLAAEAARGQLRIIHLRNDRARGPAESRNRGWRTAAAALVAFTDDDCVASPGWLQAGLAAWGGDPLRFVQGSTTPIETERDRLGRRAYSYEVTAPDDDYQTLNMFYPRSLLVQLGGFDSESFPAVGEDTDLGWRARERGAECVFAPAAAVQHAVIELDLRRAVRRSWSWGGAALLYRRHPDLRRRRLLFGVFWNWYHLNTVRAWLALLLPSGRGLWPLRLWLARPWLRDRGRDPVTRRCDPGRAAWFAVLDTVEVAGMARGGIRHRTVVL
jgi:GT2 family glycosyltransferase